MKKPAIFLLLLLATSVDAWNQGLEVVEISGQVKLVRADGEPWPLEKGQRLLGGDRLISGEGAMIRLLFSDRVEIHVEGNSQLGIESVMRITGSEESWSAQVKPVSGFFAINSQYLFDAPSTLHLDLPGGGLAVPAGSRWLVAVDAKAGESFARVTDTGIEVMERGNDGLQAKDRQKKREIELFDSRLQAAVDIAVPLLVMTRDYDKDLKKWPNPAVLGPVLMRELGSKYPRQLNMVQGSGTTMVARTANHAIKTSKDTWLKKIGIEHNARWILVGNLVVGDPDVDREDDKKPATPVFRGRAEARLIEAFPEGKILISDQASVVIERVGRDMDESRRLALEGAAEKLAGHLSFHIGELLAGRSHTQGLLSVTYSNVDSQTLGKLKDAVGKLEAVQRMFSRRTANGVFKVDLVPRKDEADLMQALRGLELDGWKIEEGGVDDAGARLFSLQKD